MKPHANLKHTPRLLTLCLCLVLLLCLALPALAHEVPDLTRKGSITLNMVFEGQPVGGGTMTLYRVGDIEQDNGDFLFRLTEVFAPSGAVLTDPMDPAAALSLEKYARDNKVARTDKKVIDENGQVVFSELEPGLYLLSQDVPASGFEAIAPFLISVPMNQDGHYEYNPVAQPKTDLVPKPTTPPTVPTTPLAKTGQSVIPIYVLASIGVVLVLAGWLMTQRRPGDDPSDTEAPEAPKPEAVPETAEASEAPEATEAVEAPEGEAAPEAAEDPENPDTPDTPDPPANQT